MRRKERKYNSGVYLSRGALEEHHKTLDWLPRTDRQTDRQERGRKRKEGGGNERREKERKVPNELQYLKSSERKARKKIEQPEKKNGYENLKRIMRHEEERKFPEGSVRCYNARQP